MPELERIAVRKFETRKNIMGYELPGGGKIINVMGEGKLVNIVAGDGHPAEIMDLSFAVQIMGALYVLEHRGSLPNALVDVSSEIDDMIARRKLNAWEIEIDSLTEEQEKYLESWQ